MCDRGVSEGQLAREDDVSAEFNPIDQGARACLVVRLVNLSVTAVPNRFVQDNVFEDTVETIKIIRGGTICFRTAHCRKVVNERSCGARRETRCSGV